MIHRYYLHPGVAAMLLALSRAKRRIIVNTRIVNIWLRMAYDAPSAVIEESCMKIAREADCKIRMLSAEVATYERDLGVRK